MLSAVKQDGNFRQTNPSVYVATETLSAGWFTDSVQLSSTFAYVTGGKANPLARGPGIEAFEIFDYSLYSTITTYRPKLSGFFKETPKQTITLEGEETKAK